MSASDLPSESRFHPVQRDAWREAGWLRALDVAFTDWLLQLEPKVPDSLLVAAALLCHLESRGHSNLPLGPLARTEGDRAAPRPGPWTAPVDLAEGAAGRGVDLRAVLLGWPAPGLAEASQRLARLPADPQACEACWSGATRVLELDPPNDAGTTPLVLQHGRLYLRRYWRHEVRIAAAVSSRLAVREDWSPHALAQTAHWLRTLFPRPATTPPAGAPASPPTPTPAPEPAAPDWQAIACAVALRSGFTVITGGPGTGKTYTAARLLLVLHALRADRPAGAGGLRVALAAPTGKAAARLRQSIERALSELQSTLPPLTQQALGLAALATTLPAAVTLHRLLGARSDTRRMARNASSPLELDLLIVDEASMVHLEMMDALLSALSPSTRLVLLGDKDQLASVEAGAVLGDLCEPAVRRQGGRPPVHDAATARWIGQLTGFEAGTDGDSALSSKPDLPAIARQTVVLQQSRRFSGPIGELARSVNAGDAATAHRLLRATADGPVALRVTVDPREVAERAVLGRHGQPGSYRDYLQCLRAGPGGDSPEARALWTRSVLRAFDRMRVLCALREGPWGAAGLNAAIEAVLAEQGELPRQRDEWYVGRPVLITRNDASLGVFNGDIGIVLPAAPQDRAWAGSPQRRVWFDDAGALRSVSVNRLAGVETAFAMTVHKSQGSEFGHVVVALPDRDSPVLTRELLYTGITRAREACTLIAGDAALVEHCLARRTRRISGLSTRLDSPD